VPPDRLALFAEQDAWLIRDIHRLDGQLVARAPTPEVADLLVRKLTPKAGAVDLLAQFGAAFGLPRARVLDPVPRAGCAALVSLFYFQLSRGTFVEALATLAASETIFLEICGRIEAPLRDRYGLSSDALAFVSFHDVLEETERETTEVLRELVTTDDEREVVTRAVELLYATEKLFYDTVLAG